MIDGFEAALQRIEAIHIEAVHIDSPAVQEAGAVEYSFIGDMVEDPRARLNELFARLWNTVSKYADVATPAARTTVAWSGNVRSAVGTLAGPQGLQRHTLAVAKDVADRTQWLKVLIASTAVVTGVAAATANPVAIPAAFRACWKLVGELEALLGAD